MDVIKKRSKINKTPENKRGKGGLLKAVTITALAASILASDPVIKSQSNNNTKTDFNNEYVTRGFRDFKYAFKALYKPEHYEVFDIMVEAAQMIIDENFPELAQHKQSGQKTLNISELFKAAAPMVQSMLPAVPPPKKANENSEDFPSGSLPEKLTSLKDRRNVSFEQTVELSRLVAEKIAPAIYLKIEELLQEEKIITNKKIYTDTPNTKAMEKILAVNKRDLQEAKHEIAELKIKNAGSLRIDTLQERIEYLELIEKEYENRLKVLKQNSMVRIESYYNKHTDEMNLKQEYTIDDAIVLIHETGHAISKNFQVGLLSEVAPITSEFIAGRYLASQGLGNTDFIAERVYDMKYDACTIISVFEVLEEYKKTGDISYATVNNAMTQSGRRGKPSEEYGTHDATVFASILEKMKYFIGTTAALVLKDKIKCKEDLQNLFDIINNSEFTDAQKLKQLGVNKESTVIVLSEFIKENESGEKEM